MTDQAPGRAAPRYAWTLIALLWLVSFLNAADRSILVATMPLIRDAFDLSATQLALINSVFYWIYAGAVLVSGRLGDSVRRTRIIVWGLIFWSVATGAMSLAGGFALLLAIRATVAVGESSYYPSATALISDWHGERTRSRALALHQTGLFAGAGNGALAAGVAADHWGWHAPFVMFAALGMVWALVLAMTLRDGPKLGPAGDAVEPLSVATGKPFGTVLRNPGVLILCCVFFLANGASTGVMVWAPTFAHDLLRLDLTGSALLGSTTINAAGFFAVPIGGILADRLVCRSPIGAFHALAIGLAIAGVCLLPLFGARTALVVAAILIASSFGKGLFDGCIYAAMHGITPPETRATAVGLMTTFGFVGGGLSPLVVANVGDAFGLAIGMLSLAAAYFLAVAILLTNGAALRRARQTLCP